MIDPNKIVLLLRKLGITNFFGVPDSNLKYFINLLDKNKKEHFVCTNEGAAVSMAIGSYLSTKKISAVYLQNSGLSNALNPLLSIAHSKVYSIPLLLIIGWRGSPGSDDEPQHLVKGKITPALLKLAGIKTCILNTENDFKKLRSIIKFSKNKKVPVAILIRNNNLLKTKNQNSLSKNLKKLDICRKDIINELCDQLKKKTYIVSNTGYASRELSETLKIKKKKNVKPFYMIGGMGHTAMVALSNAINKKMNDTICLDGDGSLIMHLGSLVSSGNIGLKNFKHILVNNFQHDSVGGQASNVEKVTFTKLAKYCGYKKILICSKKKDLKKKIELLINSKSLTFLEIRAYTNTFKNLSRPKNFFKIKKEFME